MNNYKNLTAVAISVIVFLFLMAGLVSVSRIDPKVSAQTSATQKKTPDEYRKKVLERIDGGDRVRVPDERIGELTGAVKLIDKTRSVKSMGDKSVNLRSLPNYESEIAEVAGQVKDSRMRDELNAFAKSGSDDARAAFINGGKFYTDQLNAKAVPQPTDDATKKCYDSCETITRILCKEVCEWDCRIVNGEKVCEKSCSTICPEVTNIVCKKVCD